VAVLEEFFDRGSAWATLREEQGTAPFPENGWSDWVASGRFRVQCDRRADGGPGREVEEGPNWLTLDDALAWGRARAARIDLWCWRERDNVCFSAGEIDISTPDRGEDDPRRIEPWPPEGLHLKARRLPGFEHLDRTEADEPIAWNVKILGNARDRPQDEVFAQAWAAGLRRQPGVELLDSRVWPIPPLSPSQLAAITAGRPYTTSLEPEGVGAELRVTAATHADAQALAAGAGAAAIAQALAHTKSVPKPWQWQEPIAFPSDSRLARNTNLDQSGLIY
jgi:hypothetical protein